MIGGYFDATSLLDAVRAGAQVREELILVALRSTGDLRAPVPAAVLVEAINAEAMATIL